MATIYWIGNGGSWTNVAHWSTGTVPTKDDDVIFDGSSFSLSGQTVTIPYLYENTYRSVKSLTFAEVTNSPTFDISSIDGLYVWGGAVVFSASMTIVGYSNNPIYFNSGTSSLLTNGLLLPSIYLGKYGSGATNPSLTLLSSVSATYDVKLTGGIFNTGNFSINCRTFDIAPYTDSLEVNLGSSIISCRYLDVDDRNTLVVNAGTSKIVCSYSSYVMLEYYQYGGNNYLYDVELSSPEIDIYGGLNCHNFTTTNTPYVCKNIYVAAPAVITVTGDFSVNGSNSQQVTLRDYFDDAPFYVTKVSGGSDVSISYVTLLNSIAQGGATFYSLTVNGCVDDGGNSGWIFEMSPAPVLVEPKGTYNEGDHFAYAPGDSGGTAVWREPSASSTPVTPTHRPGCGYWFKEVGTIYGGKVGPWVPWNVDQKVEFNEGSSLVKAPVLSGGTAVWEMGKTGQAVSSVHAPCGYWFKNYDDDERIRRICLGLEMGYTKTDMVVDEQQTLYVKDVNGDTVDCQITTWSLVGVGSLSGSVGPSVIYTAPSTSIPGADSATITLWCGGAVKDTLVISVAHSCDCLDTINYTSLQMSVDQQQTLTASGEQSDDCYSWAITSGGGSLSAATGKSVVYTAPSSNANCASNPTITLTCGGSVVDTITMAVNAVVGYGVGWYFTYSDISVCPACSSGSCQTIPGSPPLYLWNPGRAERIALQCSGSTSTSGFSTPFSGLEVDCGTAFEGWKRKAMRELMSGLFPVPPAVWDSWYDNRSEVLKGQGCCPAQLI